jgi:hypothetical protein
MKRLPAVLLLLTILVLPLLVSYHSISTEDCFVQIVSVTLNQPSLEIGERLQVSLVYDLYYDYTDPLGIGSISVSISIEGSPTPLSFYEFTTLGLEVNKIITFDISSNDWSPNETGQFGIVQVEGWVQDTVGSMTDTVQQQFSVDRSDLFLEIDPLSPQISFHENFNITGTLFNLHNCSLSVPNHPLIISVTQNNHTLQSWNAQTTATNNFTQPINSTLLGTGEFYCRVIALDSTAYRTTNSTFLFLISKANLSLTVNINATTVQAYYPSMNNCSVLVSVYLQCEMANHGLTEANVTCYLGNTTKILTYVESNQFSTELRAPSLAGAYCIYVTATALNHNPVNVSVPLIVDYRQPQISFTANCSEAAHGDFIRFSLNAIDISSQAPIPDKICSIYLYNHSTWNLLGQVTLDHSGCAQFLWQTQHVGDEDFRFKVHFQGSPEFNDSETETRVTNTHDFRFIGKSSLCMVRFNVVDYVLQLTSLDYEPLFNVSVQLIESATNFTWCISVTNTSGYAILSWAIDENFSLGPHEFLLIVQEENTTRGIIHITMIVYEQTILELV